MHATICLRRGFWGRSIDELKRQTQFVINMEGIKGPSGPLELHSFRDPESIQACKAMSDKDVGGYSRSHLDWVGPDKSSSQIQDAKSSDSEPTAYARFHGSISTQLPSTRPDIQRSGFAGWRTLDKGRTIFGKSLWNIDQYTYLAMRIKSDGRSYLINLQTESLIPTDLHQHRLFAKRPGQWETILVKWNDFVRTNHGFVVEPQAEILRQKVRSVGVGLTDRVPGPFELCIERIWATNDERDASDSDRGLARLSGLRSKRGEAIEWEIS
ncbi:hypothetical protein PspLS_01437 [Pyricularia sp. CBS 133598]|nr:hypothetical protein PspLS_01437 [Pyricularia sp. CBS 133598]